MSKQKLLHSVQCPEDLKRLPRELLGLLCSQIRERLLQTVSRTGGHLASNLGTVELTVALHRVFNMPEDQIVWDVGHQAYVHKLLTGRQDQFDTLRTKGGISGFPKHAESPYDSFIAGHSSTSISAAYGLARAKALQNQPGYVVAVIGDGAFTGGLAYEALNNAGRTRDRLIVVLNDNEMAISKNVGSLAKYLAKIRTRQSYFKARDRVEKGLESVPLVGEGLRQAVKSGKNAVKRMLYHSNLFEDFGFDYFGPVNGHDIQSLCDVFERAKEVEHPVLVHVQTVKGKGYRRAEEAPDAYHGMARFDPRTGDPDIAPADSFSTVFGNCLCEEAAADERICAITAAMKQGTGLEGFSKRFPRRFYDVGIAEQHAVTFAAGMAAGGEKPVFAVYSTFLQRAYDQILHDASIERQHVVLAVDRAGLVGEDGETHQGLFDVPVLTTIPGMSIYAPVNYTQLGLYLKRALQEDGPCALRYPRGKEPEVPQRLATAEDFVLDNQCKANMLVITYGRVTAEVLSALEILRTKNCPAALLVLGHIWPLPQQAIALAQEFPQVLFVEEGMRSGGIGEHLLGRMAERGYQGKYRIRAVENCFVPQGTVAEQLKMTGLDGKSIADFMLQEFKW